MSASPNRQGVPGSPRFLDRVRAAMRVRHRSRRTEQAYVGWIRRFILFHGKRHPEEMGAEEVERFLSYLATHRRVSASTQNQALCALLFLYREILKRPIDALGNIVRAKRPKNRPVVMTRPEVRSVLARLVGVHWLIAGLLYGSGLRLLECLRLRVKDIDFSRGEIVVRDGKGRKSRVTMLPANLRDSLTEHLESVRQQHESAIARGFGGVEMPFALARKYPNADKEWCWQYVFPASKPSRDPVTGALRRHHVHESGGQRAVKAAARAAGIAKPVTPHTFRHYADSRIMPTLPSRRRSGLSAVVSRAFSKSA
ncbi:integron integrase [Planctomycetota bacterium]